MMDSMYTNTNTNISNLNGITYNSTTGITTLSNSVTFIGSDLNFGNSLQTTTLNFNSTAKLRINCDIFLPTSNLTIGQLQLSYLNGLSGNIQTQFGLYALKASLTFTGTITAPIINVSGLLRVNNNIVIQSDPRYAKLTIKTGDALGSIDANSCSYVLDNAVVDDSC